MSTASWAAAVARPMNWLPPSALPIVDFPPPTDAPPAEAFGEAELARHVLNPYGIKLSGANNAYSFHARDPHKADLEMPVGFYGQPVYFALWAQAYKAKYGLKEETLGEIAV